MVLFVAVALVVLPACSQKYYPAMYQPAEGSPVQEQMSHLNDPAPVAKPDTTQVVSEPEAAPVRVTETTDTYTVDGRQADYTFYIVVGSFANADNAKKMCGELASKGVGSKIALSDKGMNRVVLDYASNDELAIRGYLMRVRAQFSDAWILKLKK